MNAFKKRIGVLLLCISAFSYTNLVTTDKTFADEINHFQQLSTQASKNNDKMNSFDIIEQMDSTLKTFILSSLGKPIGDQLTYNDLAQLTSLYLSGESAAQITSFSGLEYAVNLDSFNMMTTTRVTDFSSLEKLTKLTYVRLQGENVTTENFPDLSNNPSINLISLTGANVDDQVLDKLIPLKSLEKLFIEYNENITTITPLKSLPKLKTLYIQYDGVADFTVLNAFPALTILGAYGQNIGKQQHSSTIHPTDFDYQSEAQTLFIPFSIMPNRLTNFDGYLPPFTTSNAVNNTILTFNNSQIAPERIQITGEGLLVSNVSQEEYEQLSSLSYSARIDNPAGSYLQPASYSFYSISNGIYNHKFNIVNPPEPGAPITVHYLDEVGNELASLELLKGNIGERYSSSAKEIPGWILIHTPENQTGVFTDQPQKITYNYTKAEGAPVIVDYVDVHGKKIAKSESLNGKLNDFYETSSKYLNNWQLRDLPQNSKGIFTAQEQIVTYVYEAEKNEVSINSNNFPVVPENTLNQEPLVLSYPDTLMPISETRTANDSLLPLTELPTMLKKKEGTFVIEPKTGKEKKELKKKKKTGTVTIKYVDEHGREISSSSTLHGEVGDSFSAIAKDLSH
ncbi:hypothetical protein A5821_002207 [Enterococcus sp. 7F3_DIV0205]|uniref:MucBP domain-containing protein n=1 Tax=Candidatus Enterococcus palustris TaxID=1834189 RepID=A0AAQ3WBN6_9ENTE|nr:MucBP domain-containing protein [Enterococcus sp. 7F3_DIV0205]OTN82646.1 hypothetical protein A5821_002557 [Enterococcus sp. 7F3_DIV0205]